jgi:hypothetical protein
VSEVGLHREADMSWLPNSRPTAVPDEGGPLNTSTVKIIHTTPRDITHGR